MNGFFKKPALITILSLGALFFAYVFTRYVKLAFTPQTQIIPSSPAVERGLIVDRAGKPLAVQTNFYHVGVTPRLIKNIDAFVKDTADILEMTEADERNIITGSDNSGFVYLKKKIDNNTYVELKKITDSKNYNFVNYDRIPGRVYPENALASQLIGYMGDDGKGLAGIEYSMQDILAPAFKNDGTPPEHGKSVYLTIDANLQYKLEEIARNAMSTTQAESVILVAANANTGEILSYISLPSANLNEYGSASIQQVIDRPAMSAYEPGSVFKIFTVALAYDAELIHAADSFYCNGMYEHRFRGAETVRIKCLGTHGWLTARDALKYSCNSVLGQISDKMTDTDFVAGIRLLGFGRRTGIELPSETAGSVKDVNSKLWSGRSKPTIAIGQEISVSALQMVQAASAIAHKGVPVQPAVIKKITNKDGTVYFEHEPVYKDRVLKESTADYILSCMETTATSGTGSRAHINDIAIGVKTGTAQMADKENGGYSSTDFISNCIAIFPIDKPEIILYIVIEKAKGETYAGRIVAPVIKETADAIIDHLGMSRGDAASLEHSGRISIKAQKPITLGTKLPNFTGMSKRELLPLFSRTDIHVKINGSGWVTSQNPAPGTPVTENMTIELNLE